MHVGHREVPDTETPVVNGSGNPVSIIIPHYSNLENIRECLDSILRSDANSSEIIVVDNASLDNCSERLEPLYPEVRFVRSEANLGSAGGWNLGADQASGEILVFLNDDVVTPDRWLLRLIRPLEDPHVGCVCPLVLFKDDPSVVNSIGGICDIFGFGQNQGIGDSAAGVDSRDGAGAFYAVGTALATRRTVLRRTGGFDQSFFMYAEDLDWSWRLRLYGFSVALEPQSRIYHKWRGSGLDLEQTMYYLERNQLRSLVKNYSASTLILIAPVLLILKLLRGIWLSVRQAQLAKTTFRSWYWNLENLVDTLSERRRIQSERLVKDREVMRFMQFASLEISHAFGKVSHPLSAGLGIRIV